MVWWCLSVRVSVRPTLRPSVRPGLHPPVFHTFLMPLLELTILEIHSFLHFSLTYFDILSSNFAHDFVIYCTTDQVRVSSISVKFCASYAPFVTYNTGNTQFSAFFSYMLWHIQLKFCTWFCYTVLQIKFQCCQFASIFVGVMLLLELRILEIHSFPHFSLTCFDILSWNFAHDFVLLNYRPSSSVVNLRQFLWELCPFWNLEYLKYSFSALFSYMLEIQFFRTFLLHALTYWAEIFHMTLFNVLQIKFECRHFVSIHPFYLKYKIWRWFL